MPSEEELHKAMEDVAEERTKEQGRIDFNRQKANERSAIEGRGVRRKAESRREEWGWSFENLRPDEITIPASDAIGATRGVGSAVKAALHQAGELAANVFAQVDTAVREAGNQIAVAVTTALGGSRDGQPGSAATATAGGGDGKGTSGTA
jgi:hypothetical protein